MNLTNNLATWVLLRQMRRHFKTIEQHAAERNVLLKRIADHFSPIVEQTPVETSTRSVDYSEDHLQAVLIEFSEKRVRDLGRPATDEEMIEFLDELAEKTAKQRS